MKRAALILSLYIWKSCIFSLYSLIRSPSGLFVLFCRMLCAVLYDLTISRCSGLLMACMIALEFLLVSHSLRARNRASVPALVFSFLQKCSFAMFIRSIAAFPPSCLHSSRHFSSIDRPLSAILLRTFSCFSIFAFSFCWRVPCFPKLSKLCQQLP